MPILPETDDELDPIDALDRGLAGPGRRPQAVILPEIRAPGPAAELLGVLEAERALGRLDQLLADPRSAARFQADAARREALASAKLDQFLVRWDELVLTTTGPGMAPRANRAAALQAYDIWRSAAALQTAARPQDRRNRGDAGDAPDDEDTSESGYLQRDSLGPVLSVDLVEEVFRRSQLVSSGRAPENLRLTDEQRAAVEAMLVRVDQALALPGLLGAAMAIQALHQVEGLERPGVVHESPRGGQGDPSLRRYMAAHPTRPLDWRLARLLAPTVLARGCRLRCATLWLSPAFAADSAGYRRLIGAPPSQWIRWFGERVRAAAEDACRRTADLTTLAERWRKAAGPRRANSKVGAAIDHLFERPMVNARTLQRALGMSPEGARLLVADLKTRGILRELPDRTTDRLYVADQLTG